MTVIGVIAQGMMGAGVGRRLRESGAEVRTLLSGRSPASAERARAAGMAARGRRTRSARRLRFLFVDPAARARPSRSPSRLAPALKALDRKPVYVDCNAVSPQTAIRIGEIIAPTGADFVDGGIIGGPPRPGYSPTIYASGPTAGQTAVLRDWGIDWRVIDGPIGAASAVKMSYAGITKGTTAIAAAMLLGAARFGCAEALIAELPSSQPQMLARMRNGIPGMYDKAYRWVAEMEEISDFLEQNPPSRDMYAAIARLYDYLAAAKPKPAPARDNAIRTLDRVLGRG